MFKWSFNIKPDLVIHIDKNTAICIETKYKSGVSSYPTTKEEKEIFKRRKINGVKQTEVQQHMMEEILGIDTKFFYISTNKVEADKIEPHKSILWKEAFEGLDTSELAISAQKMIEKISKESILTVVNKSFTLLGFCVKIISLDAVVRSFNT